MTEKIQFVQLSKRLQMLTELVTKGNVVADVGCDHGFLSIYLVQQGISSKIIASDVRTGPLAAAKEHVAKWQLEDYIETRLSDGLKAYKPGEAQTLVCAGMGGPLMQNILMQSKEVTDSLEELILQPQSELREFRVFLREQCFKIEEERILLEEGKYYFAFRVCHAKPEEMGNAPEKDRRLYDKYGEQLLQDKNLVLQDYLRKSLDTQEKIQSQILKHQGNDVSEKNREALAEVTQEIADLKEALSRY